MKKNFLNSENSGLLMMLVMLLCSIFGIVDAGAMTADVVRPAGGGAVRKNSSNTAGNARDDSPDLLLDTIDNKVCKIRPHSVVLDTISRQVKDVKNSNSQIISHYAIDVLESSATVTTSYAGGDTQTSLDTSNNDIFSCDETLLVLGVQGYKEDQVTPDPIRNLMLYVVGKDASGNKIMVVPLNGMKNGLKNDTIPAIPANTVLKRMGRAGSETQIQTDAYSGVPTDFTQYLQKFMAQVEESTLMKIADKEVDWDFSDQEEEALFDMRRGQNATYWCGVKSKRKIKNSRTDRAEDIFFTEGVWTQAGKDFSFGGIPVDAKNMVTLMKHAFTGNASGKKKLLIAGSDVIEAFEQVEYNRVVYVGSTHQAYGLEFNSIKSKFGTLLVVHDETLDDMGMAKKAFILDPDYLRKWSMGWRVQDFDFKGSGQKDVEGRSLIEIAGLVLKNPNAHSRVSL